MKSPTNHWLKVQVHMLQWNPTLWTPLKSGHLRFPNAFTKFNVRVQSKCEIPIFHEADRFPSPNSTWTVQNSLDNVLLAAFVRLCATSHGFKNWDYINTVTHCASFLNIVQQQRGPKIRTLGAQKPENTLAHPLEVCWMPLNYRYFHIVDTQQWSQRCPL